MNQEYTKKLEKVIMHSFMSIVDFNTDTKELQFIITSPKTKQLEIFNTTYEQMMSYTKKKLLHPEDKMMFDHILKEESLKALSTTDLQNCSYEFQCRMYEDDKDYRWLKGRIIMLEKLKKGYHILCSFQDYSEDKQKELEERKKNICRMIALKKSFEELYEVDVLHNCFYAFNVNDKNQLKSTNMYEYKDMKQVIMSHVHPDDRIICEKYLLNTSHLRKCFRNGQKHVAFEYRIQNDEDSPYRWVSADIVPLETTKEKETAFMFMRDITAQKEKIALEMKLETLREQVKAQVHHYEMQVEAQQRVRAFRHDMKNHLLVLSTLFDEHKDLEFHDYIANMKNQLIKKTDYIDSGNTILDALLNDKLSYARNIGIHVETSIKLRPDMALTGMDTCILFGNALDNAIEACMSSMNKELKLHLVYAHDMLVIRLSNSIAESVKQTGVSFKTTKSDAEAHGMGILNMKKIIEEHDGLFELKQEGDFVILQISLCLPNKK